MKTVIYWIYFSVLCCHRWVQNVTNTFEVTQLIPIFVTTYFTENAVNISRLNFLHTFQFRVYNIYHWCSFKTAIRIKFERRLKQTNRFCSNDNLKLCKIYWSNFSHNFEWNNIRHKLYKFWIEKWFKNWMCVLNNENLNKLFF